jgi:hypothetical protein
MATSANEEDAIVCCEGINSSESVSQKLLAIGLCSEVRTTKTTKKSDLVIHFIIDAYKKYRLNAYLSLLLLSVAVICLRLK